MDDIGIIEAWLASKGVTLWADWDVTSNDRVQLAAAWFKQQMHEFWEFSSEYWDKVSTERFDVV